MRKYDGSPHFTCADETRTFLEMDTLYVVLISLNPICPFRHPIHRHVFTSSSECHSFQHFHIPFHSNVIALSSPLSFQLGIYIFDKYDALIRIPAALLLPVSTNYLLFNYTTINVCAEKLMARNCRLQI